MCVEAYEDVTLPTNFVFWTYIVAFWEEISLFTIATVLMLLSGTQGVGK